MPIFISYNHSDKNTAETLAKFLVKAKQNVWIDKWELNAGDSLIERIENALGGADAILVLLSKDSIKSQWCRKELKSGLIRELEEKSVLVIPIVLDDCKIPLFLREKLCIDLRKDKDDQLALLLRSLERISNPAQSRVETLGRHIDWAMCHIEAQGQNGVEWVFVEQVENMPYVIMTQVIMFPIGNAAKKFNALNNDDDRFHYSAEIMNTLLEASEDFRVKLSTTEANVSSFMLSNNKSSDQFRIRLTVRRMGDDNGMDTLVQVENYLRYAISHTLGALRQGGWGYLRPRRTFAFRH